VKEIDDKKINNGVAVMAYSVDGVPEVIEYLKSIGFSNRELILTKAITTKTLFSCCFNRVWDFEKGTRYIPEDIGEA